MCIYTFGAIQILFETRITGSLLSFQQPQFTQHHRSSTNGSNRFTFCSKIKNQFTQSFVLVKCSSSRHSSRQQQQFSIEKIAILEVDIAKDRYVMCSHYNFIRCNGYDFYIQSGTSQRVNSSKGFNFFKTICKKSVYSSHNPLYIWLMILSQVKIIGDCPCLVIHSIDRIKTGFLSCILRCFT